MGNRILKESICTSENIDALSYFQEVFFYRMIVKCDDFGRVDARPRGRPDDALSVVFESDAVVKLSPGGSTDDSVYGKQMQA